MLLSLCEEGCACHPRGERRSARQPVVGKPVEEGEATEEAARLVRPPVPVKITPQWLQDVDECVVIWAFERGELRGGKGELAWRRAGESDSFDGFHCFFTAVLSSKGLDMLKLWADSVAGARRLRACDLGVQRGLAPPGDGWAQYQAASSLTWFEALEVVGTYGIAAKSLPATRLDAHGIPTEYLLNANRRQSRGLTFEGFGLKIST